MNGITILQSVLEALASDTGNLILRIIANLLLFSGLVYTIVHLAKLMFEPEERDIIFEEVMMEIEKHVS